MYMLNGSMWCILQFLFDMVRSGGGGGVPPWTPSPPSPLKLGGKCRTIGAKGAGSKFCFMWQKAKKGVSTPSAMCIKSDV